MITDSQFLTVEQVARLLHVTPTTVYRAIARGTLPAVRLSAKVVRIPAAALTALTVSTPDSTNGRATAGTGHDEGNRQ
jgi:excisionase family DNA binding protein